MSPIVQKLQKNKTLKLFIHYKLFPQNCLYILYISYMVRRCPPFFTDTIHYLANLIWCDREDEGRELFTRPMPVPALIMHGHRRHTTRL